MLIYLFSDNSGGAACASNYRKFHLSSIFQIFFNKSNENIFLLITSNISFRPIFLLFFIFLLPCQGNRVNEAERDNEDDHDWGENFMESCYQTSMCYASILFQVFKQMFVQELTLFRFNFDEFLNVFI